MEGQHPTSPPIAAPDGARPHLPPTNALLGHFLCFTLLGQLVFTFLALTIASNTRGQEDASLSITRQLALLWVPLAFAAVGALTSKWWPSRWCSSSLAIVLAALGIAGLGMIDLFILVLTRTAGYC